MIHDFLRGVGNLQVKMGANIEVGGVDFDVGFRPDCRDRQARQVLELEESI